MTDPGPDRPALRLGKDTLRCPCGELLRGEDEDDLVERAQAHLRAAHPGRAYSREDILFLAY